MKRVRRANLLTIGLSALLTTILAIGLLPATPSPAAALPGAGIVKTSSVDLYKFKQQIFEGTNAERSAKKVTKLKSSWHLDSVAQTRANELVKQQQLAHDVPRLKQLLSGQPGWSNYWGENLAWRSHSANVSASHYDGKAAVNAWIKSSGHHANMVSSKFTHIGIGAAFDPKYGLVYVQVFSQNAAGDDNVYTSPTTTGKEFSRVNGTDRYATATEVSKRTHPETASKVYLAAGGNFPDALAAVPAAARAGAPLLLVPKNASQVPQSVISRVKELNPSEIIVVGGTGVITNGAVNAVKKSAPNAAVTRIGGADRYATANALVSRTFTGVTGGTVYVATGRDFPDALSASAIASASGAPIVLVDGKGKFIPQGTLNTLKTLKPSSIVIVGGEGVISPALAQQLSGIAKTSRLAGADRFATNVAVNSSMPKTEAYLATGRDFPDALTGSLLAGVNDAPLYLSNTHCIPKNVHTTLSKTTEFTLIGGTGVLSSGVASFRSC